MTLNDKNSNILNIEIECYDDCGYSKSDKDMPELRIPWDIWAQWLYISQCMDDKEWGAVFKVKDNAITSYKIPEQEVSGSECEFKEELGGDGIIHSHHTMGAFHSRKDDAHARNLYTYSIVISNTGSICTKRVKLPCGGYGYKDTKLILIGVPDIDMTKIKESTYIYQKNYNNDWDKREDIDKKRLEQADYDRQAFEKCDTCNKYDCEHCEVYTQYCMNY
jgi:hypothetical protein